MPDSKSFSCTFKALDEAAGTGRAVFATLNVVDKDGDLTPPGAFGNQVAKLAGAHDWVAAPIGLAKISERGDEAVADLKFNLAMPSAREWYEAVRFQFENGVTQEYSYGFDVLEESVRDIDGRKVRVLEKLKVFEVSPVMVGAGVNTRTVAMKTCRSCGGSARPEPARAEEQAGKLDQLISESERALQLVRGVEEKANFSDRVVALQYVKQVTRLVDSLDAIRKRLREGSEFGESSLSSREIRELEQDLVAVIGQ